MKKLLNAGGRPLDLSTPAVMGILNLTPDSFHEASRFSNLQDIIHQTHVYLEEGATIIDIGAQSTRPGAEYLSANEEWQRLEPVLKPLTDTFPNSIFSIDTFHAEIAEKAFDHGVTIINDISGGTLDQDMFATVARLQVPYILMHIQGTPKTMQVSPRYENVIEDILSSLSDKLQHLRDAGLNQIIIDPGFGFGKSMQQNYEILHELRRFEALAAPLLVGLSRKSMINRVLNVAPEAALNGTTVLNTIALMGGASILRVHDVKPAVEAVKLFMAYKQAGVIQPTNL